jgi:hypothetical protein
LLRTRLLLHLLPRLRLLLTFNLLPRLRSLLSLHLLRARLFLFPWLLLLALHLLPWWQLVTRLWLRLWSRIAPWGFRASFRARFVLSRRRIGYALSLRLLRSFSLSTLLSPARLRLNPSFISPLLISLSPLLISLARLLFELTRLLLLNLAALLFQLTRLSLRLSVAARGFGLERVYLLLTLMIHLLESLATCIAAIVSTGRSASSRVEISIVSNLQLLIPDLIRNSLHSHRSRHVSRKPCLARSYADKDWRVSKFFGNTRRQIGLTSPPRRMNYGVSQRRHR